MWAARSSVTSIEEETQLSHAESALGCIVYLSVMTEVILFGHLELAAFVHGQQKMGLHVKSSMSGDTDINIVILLWDRYFCRRNTPMYFEIHE